MSKSNEPHNNEELMDEAVSIFAETTLEMPDGETETLADCALDINKAHKELQQYKEGALALMQAIDERKIEAEQAGDDELVALLSELRHVSHGVYVRLQRGDEEVLGDRDGEYSGYLDKESVKT